MVKLKDMGMKFGKFAANNPDKWTWEYDDTIGDSKIHVSVDGDSGDEDLSNYHVTEDYSGKLFKIRFRDGVARCQDPPAWPGDGEDKQKARDDWYKSDFSTALYGWNGNRDDDDTNSFVEWAYDNWADLKEVGKEFWDGARA